MAANDKCTIGSVSLGPPPLAYIHRVQGLASLLRHIEGEGYASESGPRYPEVPVATTVTWAVVAAVGCTA